jgi:hypothetical protein
MDQGAIVVEVSLGLPEMLRKYCLMRSQATLREVGDLRFYLMLVVPDELTLKILSPEQWNYRILIRQCRESGYSECAGC